MTESRINRWFWAGLRFLASGIVFVFLLAAVGRFVDRQLSFEPRLGSTKDSSLVDMTAASPLSPLANDFEDAEVRNVILLVADGMGFSHVLAARSELSGLNRPLGFERMPITGWLSTHEANRLIPDSGATATSMATGVKTASGHLGIDAEGKPVGTILEAARARGMSAGLVTDSYLWDATPMAFAVHAGRRQFGEIVTQLSRSGVEMLFGESCTKCLEDVGGEEWMKSEMGKGGYVVTSTLSEAAGTASDALVAGLFAPGSIADPEQSPSLRELAVEALERLSADPDGFFLLVETEETDTASHQNNFLRMVDGIGKFSAAADAMLDFARQDRSTLVLVTADHETGGLSVLSGGGERKLGVHWSTYGHTALPVPLFAYGPGAERFAGASDNTSVAHRLAALLDLELEAPEVEGRE